MRVVIIEGDVFVRQGIETIVSQEFPDAVISCPDSALLPTVLSEIEAELVVCYHNTGDSCALRVLDGVASGPSSPPVLVVSAFDETEAAPVCIAAGASGLISNSAPIQDFFSAMKSLLAGGTYFSASAMKTAFAAEKNDQTSGSDSLGKLLTRREIEVFTVLGEGLPVRAIAPRLGISVKTVESHRENIKNKLSLHSASEVTVAASKWLSSKPKGR